MHLPGQGDHAKACADSGLTRLRQEVAGFKGLYQIVVRKKPAPA